MPEKKLNEKNDIWLCLRFPYLALNCADIRFSHKSAPVAVTTQQTIIQANKLAQYSGIKIGQPTEHAQMLKPSLKLIERQAELEIKRLQTLCIWAYRYTSHISIYDEHTLVLEIGRSVRFFNGLNSMQNLVLSDLEQLNIDVKFGLANTPKAAHLLSFNQIRQEQDWSITNHKAQIAQSPLRHLAISEKTLGQLHSCGFNLLKDILVIPRTQLGERFGKPFILYLEKLLGDTADPQTLHCIPETFKAKIDFAEPINNRGWIEQQIDRLLNDLIAFINSRQLACRSLTWRFYNEKNCLVDSVTVGLNMSNIKCSNLKELTDLKLSTLSLKWAFSSIELSSKELIPKSLFHQDLFDPIADQEAFNQLVDKVTSRLGNNAVYNLTMADEHLPELANIRCYFRSQATTIRKHNNNPKALNSPITQTQLEQKNGLEQKDELEQQDEPIWLLRQPQKLIKNNSQPEHDGELKLIHGPNRISSHWWQALQSRDYYIAKKNSGRLLWIYFERSQNNWYLHGLYA